METNIRVDLIEYAELFPEGHHLREIALRTAQELSRENPFDRVIKKEIIQPISVKSRVTKNYRTLKMACESKRVSYEMLRIEINSVLNKYDLLMV